jgi:hypothetical protein
MALDGSNRGETMVDSPKWQAPWWALDARRVLVIALLIALLALSARETVDPDLWWHLATGRHIVETGAIPRHDLFSYTVPDHEWITHEWLAQVLMVGLYSLGGLPALLLATCAVVTLAFALLYLQCDGRPHLAVFAVLLGALASAVTWGPRPQMLTLALAAAFTYVLHLYRNGRRWALVLYPVLTVLWVNLHSGFFTALVLLGLVILGELAARLLGYHTPGTLSLPRVRDLALALGACVLAALLNPNGARILAYPFETLGSQAMQRYIQEWASPDFHQRAYWPLALLLFGGAASLALSARRRSLTDVGLFCAFGLAALHAARHIPLFVVIATPILTRYLAHVELGRLRWDLSRRPGRPPPRRPQTVGPSPPAWVPSSGHRGGLRGGVWIVLNWALVLLLALGGAARVAGVLRDNRDVEQAHYPVAALRYLEAEGLAERRIYNSYNWGGYLLWRGLPVFIDGRADVYGGAFMDQYVLAYQVRGDWRQPLERYDVEVVLIESGSSLATLLEASDEWRLAYRDELAVVYVRQD